MLTSLNLYLSVTDSCVVKSFYMKVDISIHTWRICCVTVFQRAICDEAETCSRHRKRSNRPWREVTFVSINTFKLYNETTDRLTDWYKNNKKKDILFVQIIKRTYKMIK